MIDDKKELKEELIKEFEIGDDQEITDELIAEFTDGKGDD